MSDEYQAYKHFYLEVPISTNNIFINDKPAFIDDLFDNNVLKAFYILDLLYTCLLLKILI